MYKNHDFCAFNIYERDDKMHIILASASPRRKELMGYVVPDFEVIPANVDETVPKDMPAEKCSEYIA